MNFQELMDSYYLNEYESNAYRYKLLVEKMRKRDIIPVLGSSPVIYDDNMTEYENLLPVLFEDLIVTTNVYDNIERLYKDPCIFAPAPRRDMDSRILDFRMSGRRKQPLVVKLHGTITEPNNMLQSDRQFEHIYGCDPCDHSIHPFAAEVRGIFRHYAPFFIGYRSSDERSCDVFKPDRREYHNDWPLGFALLEMPDEEYNDSENDSQNFMFELGVRVIWYPHGEHECIGILLKKLMEDLGIITNLEGSDTMAEKGLQRKQIEEYIAQGLKIGQEEYHPAIDGFPAYISGPKYDAWMREVRLFCAKYLEKHALYQDVQMVLNNYRRNASALDDIIKYLTTIKQDDDYWENNLWEDNREMDDSIHTSITTDKQTTVKQKVFIVHGHDNAAKQEMARTLENAGFEAIILHEQADTGMTIIEKIERYTDVNYAVVLYTECDLGRSRMDPVEKERNRARQNVVFEHGYLIGKLGRDYVSALVKGDVETPGDISGVIYTKMDEDGAWKMTLARNMKAVGLPVDFNTFCR